MKYLILSATVLFTLITNCNLNDSKVTIVKDYLHNKIADESKGAIKLINLIKADGHEENIMGMKMYVLEWTAKISTVKEIWKEEFIGTGYWGNFTVKLENTESRFFGRLIPSIHLSKGAIIRLNGISRLQKTDNGWGVVESTVISGQILNQSN